MSMVYDIKKTSKACIFALKRFITRPFKKAPYFNNPTHVTLPQFSRASCLGIVSLGADSQVAAAASCLCLSPSYDVNNYGAPARLAGSTS